MGLCRRMVDLSESGETLKANGLIEIEEIMVFTRLESIEMHIKQISKR